MILTSKYTAESMDAVIDVWLDLDATAEIDENGDQNISQWLNDQRAEIADFESQHPALEPICGDGDAVEYRGTVADFIAAGFDIEIEEDGR